MKTILKTLLTSALLVSSASAFATQTTWDFRTGHEYNGTGEYFGNEISKSVSGTTVVATAWSDTDEVAGDDKIESARVSSNNYGLLNYNQKSGDYHAIDSYCGGCDSDFILLSFSQAVNLASISLGWSNFTNGYISIGAFAANASAPVLAGKTWVGVASELVTKTVLEVSNAGSASPSNLITAATGISGFSKYWLVGSYTNAFDTIARHLESSFKLAGITTHVAPNNPPDENTSTTPANAPGTLALLGMGLIALWRRQAKK